MDHATAAELEEGLAEVRRSPADGGRVALIVRRPAVEAREVVASGRLDARDGLEGDNWRTRGSTSTADGGADPDAQLTIMNVRAALLFARTEARRELAGDQILVDLDLGHANLPAGTRLGLGSAVVEVSAKPHLGCRKFSQRFGLEALRLVNSETGRAMRLRGLNARVVVPGVVRTGDAVRKLGTAPAEDAAQAV
jgi:MOSC domain-containing protein